MDLKRLIFSLLFSLCSGTFLSFAAVKPALVGRKYFLYHGLIFGGLVVGAWLALRPEGMASPVLGFAVACFVFSFFQGVRPAVGHLAFGLGCVFTFQGLGVLAAGTSWLHTVSLYNSALLLGFTMAAMLLGHWYLSVPGLPIAELRRVTLLFFIFLGLRAVFSGMALAPLLAGKSEMDLYRYFFSSTTGIFLTMRWAWGLLGPMGLGYFIWDTVRLSSTRSATGILYVAVVFVLIGETMAQYLLYFHGIPA